MGKTNFTKVESLLSEGMDKRKIKALVDETRAVSTPHEDQPRLYLIESIRYDLAMLPKYDKDLFKSLGIKKKEIINLIKKPETLSDKDWQLIKDIRTKIDERKASIAEALPQKSDEELVEFEKKRHIYKRYNVSERWLPLY